MNYLLDTNHWSYLQRRHPIVLKNIQSLSDDSTIYMSVISQAELLFGVELTISETHKKRLRMLYEQTLAETAEIIDITSKMAEKYAQVLSELRRKGKPIGTNDIWIAATAITHDLILVTNDEHFKYIDNLLIEDWTTDI